jgi:hypothetical protein
MMYKQIKPILDLSRMNKKTKFAVLLFATLWVTQLYAQDKPIQIAIIPFTPTTRNAFTITKDVQAIVASCFAAKDRFYLFDRGVTDKLKKELNAAKDNASLYSKVVAESGHLANAEYIITGIVDSVMYSGTNSKDVLSTNIKNALDAKAKFTRFHGTIHLALAIYKVETGKTILDKPYIITSREFDDYNESSILENVLCRLTNSLQTDIRALFPPMTMIVSVDKKNKKGLPEIVLVNGGSEVFDSGKQQSGCSGDEEVSLASKTSAVTSVFKKAKGALMSNKIILDVFIPEDINMGSKTLRREKVIGQLKINSIEKDLTVCSVVKGAEEIKTYMDNNKPVYVKIQKAD